jgi:hypothetical protein
VAIYAPKIALLPPEGGINSGLLSYLRAQEGIKLELVDTLEAGAYMKKIIKGISKNRRSSLLASAFAQSGNRLDAYSRALQSMKDDVALVRVSVSGDSSELDKTLSFLRETGLARAETYEALKFVVKNFVDEKIGLASGKIKKKTLAGQIADVARNRPPPAPT